MKGNRKWWMLSLGWGGPIGTHYHWVDTRLRRTACGIKLPEVYAKFVSTADLRDPALVRSKQCPDCVEARIGRRPS
jgi:hypothetical protein